MKKKNDLDAVVTAATAKTNEDKVTLMEIFNRHLREDSQITSYEHPGCHMINTEIMKDIANDITGCLKNGTLTADDLHMKINYIRPTVAKAGNTKLKGIIYIASHPLIDCYLDGLDRQQPSCSGLDGWCYVFSDYFYKSYGKQLSMFANSVLYILDPDKAKKEIQEWINTNESKFVKDRHGHIAFRIDEAGDLTYCLDLWIELARENPGINFYAYTKQFDLLNQKDYNISERYGNFQILLSDSTCDDPNPITKVREDYRVFGIKFKNPNLTPDRIKDIEIMAATKEEYNKHKCPGAKAGCFGCTKCSEKPTANTKVIIADEH